MKKMLIIFLLNFCAINLHAADEVKGKIITKTDTIEATLLIPVQVFTGETNFIKLQSKIRYLDENGRKQKLKPNQAVQITFRHVRENFKLLSRNNFFMRVIEDGYLKLFEFYYSSPVYNGAPNQPMAMSSHISSYYYLQKENDEMKRVYGMTFKNDIGDYLSDCPDVAEKVENRELRKKDIEQIVKNYNKLCTAL